MFHKGKQLLFFFNLCTHALNGHWHREMDILVDETEVGTSELNIVL